MNSLARISRRHLLKVAGASFLVSNAFAAPQAELSIVDVCGRTVVLKKRP